LIYAAQHPESAETGKTEAAKGSTQTASQKNEAADRPTAIGADAASQRGPGRPAKQAVPTAKGAAAPSSKTQAEDGLF